MPFTYVLDLLERPLSCRSQLLPKAFATADVQGPSFLAIRRRWNRVDDVDHLPLQIKGAQQDAAGLVGKTRGAQSSNRFEESLVIQDCPFAECVTIDR